MLIKTHRLLDGDAEAWERQVRYDKVLAASASLAAKEDRAHEVIREFEGIHRGSCYLGVSWGKDSVVVAHLMVAAGVQIPTVCVTVNPVNNPDNNLVRDEFKASHQLDYHEISETSEQRRKWTNGLRPSGDVWDGGVSPVQRGFARAKAMFGIAHISGVRAEESSIRTTTVARNGEISATTCRPIAYWSGEDVFAYLSKYDLPIHPAYACSFGGTIERKRLRVDFIDGEKGRGHGRSEWERAYYPDAFREIRRFAKTAVEDSSGDGTTT